ncbi:hypothetical protein F4861DRAFT_35406 [Xylaria intraflava]|nr:hypothetical protein F4861DRAFT_35406 [Xylaria intraflava]
MHPSSSREGLPTSVNTANQKRNGFNAVSDLEDYVPVREAYLQKKIRDSLNKLPPKTDREMQRCEAYLRAKWGCTDDTPNAFDPHKLEEVLNSRFKSRRKSERPSAAREKASEQALKTEREKRAGKERPIVPTASQSDTLLGGDVAPAREETCECCCDGLPDIAPTTAVTRSLDRAVTEQPAVYGGNSESNSESNSEDISEGTTEDGAVPNDTPMAIMPVRWPPKSNKPATNHRQSATKTSERPATPRIRAGSKPPLSKSAFVDGGVPCLDEECGGACKKGAKAKGRVMAPRYFPFRSRTGKR